MIYKSLFGGLQTDVRNNIEVRKQKPIKKVRQPLLIKDVHIVWLSMMGVNRQIRQEVYVYFWRMNTFKFCSGAVFELKQLALQNITKVYLEAIKVNERPAKGAFTWASFNRTVEALLGLPSLRIADLTVDILTLMQSMRSPHASCQEHGIGASTFSLMMVILPKLFFAKPPLHLTYHHFRLLVQPAEELLASGHIRQLPSKAAQQDPLEPAFHTLSLCKEVICRILHGLWSRLIALQAAHGSQSLIRGPGSVHANGKKGLCKHNSMDTPTLVNVSDLRVPMTSSFSAVIEHGDLFEYKFQTKGKEEVVELTGEHGSFDAGSEDHEDDEDDECFENDEDDEELES